MTQGEIWELPADDRQPNLGYVSPGKRSPVVLREREYVQEERNDLF
jgi:hypothetical protein